MKRLVVGLVLSCSSVIAGCGGDSSNGGDSSVCSTLKIAGGSECFDAPKSMVVVRTSAGYCSGTFITPRHVLTAAHCFELGTSSVSIQSSYFYYTAASVRIHPQFNASLASDEHDVAVVALSQDAPVAPVPINVSRPVQKGDSVVTYGFGLNESREDVYTRLENGDAPLKATSLDVIGVSAFSIDSISDGSGDTCQGDSGGSLLLDGQGGQPGVVAIVRAGPVACKKQGDPSDNTNLQNASVLNFVKGAAPGVRLN